MYASYFSKGDPFQDEIKYGILQVSGIAERHNNRLYFILLYHHSTGYARIVSHNSFCIRKMLLLRLYKKAPPAIPFQATGGALVLNFPKKLQIIPPKDAPRVL